jgi:hypothetical protein
MLKNEAQLQYSFEAIVKLHRSRDAYMKAIPESEMRNAVIDGLDIQMRKIEKEILEYLQKRQKKEQSCVSVDK